MSQITGNVEPFRVHVADDALADLRRRAAATRWPDEPDAAPWTYGTDAAFLRALVARWADGFDWRREESRLNEWSQFRAELDGVRLHFVHLRGRGPRPTPIVLTHGWPSTFVELLPLAERLADPARFGADPADSFDVVVPSLPGFGFSDLVGGATISRLEVARLWRRLMADVLGYPAFVAHGGDIGAGITSILGHAHSDVVRAIHLTAVRDPHLGPDAPPLSPREQAYQAEASRWADEEGAYAHVHATRPQTLAYALADSPAGLAGWMVEKFRAWSDCGGDVSRRFTMDQLLTTLTIYWATGTINSSMRYYAEARRRPWTIGPGDRVTVPTAVAMFPHDLKHPPREWAERFYDVRRWTEMPRGGHFPAHEEPDLLAVDLREFVGGVQM